MTLDQIIARLKLLQHLAASDGKMSTARTLSAASAALVRTQKLLDDIVDNCEDEVPSVYNEASNILCEEFMS